MSPDRRIVRVSEELFAEIDRPFGAERGPSGEPSATDFIVMDLPAIVDRVASAFEDLPEAVEGVPSLRVLVSTGRLVPAFVVYAIESTDGSIDLVGLDVDRLDQRQALVTRAPQPRGTKVSSTRRWQRSLQAGRRRPVAQSCL